MGNKPNSDIVLKFSRFLIMTPPLTHFLPTMNLPIFSKKTTLSLLDQVFDDHDVDILDMKAKVENMWKNCASQRDRRSLASREVPGCSFYGDNIGRVRIIYIRQPSS